MPSHDSFSMRQMVLQTCYSESSLKHDVKALGVLNKTTETTVDFSRLSLDGSAQLASANEQHLFALEEYMKAVVNMRTGNTLKNVRKILLYVLLIFCFEAWTTLVKEALALQPIVCKSKPTKYSLAGRAVSTLCITGVRCRDRAFRQKSIALLLKNPRKEGVRDGLFRAKIIAFLMELEEHYLEDDYVPGWARISAIKLGSDLEKHTEALIPEQLIWGPTYEIVSKTKTITGREEAKVELSMKTPSGLSAWWLSS